MMRHGRNLPPARQERKSIRGLQRSGLNQPGSRRGAAAYALDPDAAALLWQVSVDTLAS